MTGRGMKAIERTVVDNRTNAEGARIPASVCPRCGACVDLASSDEARRPVPGDFCVCVACLGINRFGEGLVLVVAEESELGQLESSEREMLDEMIALLRQARLGVRSGGRA